ncbi:endonuclease/exonuclease/phosphatase family protein [Solitalea sp. MAHUQ-68]|uniref:Endonuclease/exonuclease/phosphatase family protein n=1 Tax=Solitalea agri TaxID=2953739 RepID=A0A9X2F215_9SPHI|nr:endonuclease/exonuclease/phosphatase family protein [Solitalea agri]MCO4293157.1 endonuclease/exonuclease/phosphatase family protein [Solitalea agri]
MNHLKKRSLTHKFVVTANFVAAVFLLICYSAPFIDPVYFWPIAFFGLAYPFVLLINILFLFFWLLMWRRPAWLSFIVILIGLPFHKNSFGLNFPYDINKKPENAIRIMSYNTHYFRPINKKSNDDSTRHKIIEVIKNEHPDILCVQEFYSRRKGKFNIKDSILKIMGTRNVFVKRIIGDDYESTGLAIFSKYPIQSSKEIPFSGVKSDNTCVYADLEINGRIIRVFNIHLQSISFQQQDYEYYQKVRDSLSTDPVLTRRIARMLKKAFERRSIQAKLVSEAVQGSPYPVILCGDFNDTPLSYAFHKVSEGLNSAFTQRGVGFGKTYGGAFPNFQIDFILFDNTFEAKTYKITAKKLSDHFPIRSDIIIKQ